MLYIIHSVYSTILRYLTELTRILMKVASEGISMVDSNIPYLFVCCVLPSPFIKILPLLDMMTPRLKEVFGDGVLSVFIDRTYIILIIGISIRNTLCMKSRIQYIIAT